MNLWCFNRSKIKWVKLGSNQWVLILCCSPVIKDWLENNTQAKGWIISDIYSVVWVLKASCWDLLCVRCAQKYPSTRAQKGTWTTLQPDALDWVWSEAVSEFLVSPFTCLLLSDSKELVGFTDLLRHQCICHSLVVSDSRCQRNPLGRATLSTLWIFTCSYESKVTATNL